MLREDNFIILYYISIHISRHFTSKKVEKNNVKEGKKVHNRTNRKNEQYANKSASSNLYSNYMTSSRVKCMMWVLVTSYTFFSTGIL